MGGYGLGEEVGDGADERCLEGCGGDWGRHGCVFFLFFILYVMRGKKGLVRMRFRKEIDAQNCVL